MKSVLISIHPKWCELIASGQKTGAWRKEAVSVKRDDELMFYTECWRELQSFLSKVVRDNTGEYPFAQDVLNLMRSIERKYERC